MRQITENLKKIIYSEVDNVQYKSKFVRTNNDLMWGLSTISGVYDKEGNFQYAIWQLLDITEEYRLSKELSYQASHDLLTGLLNRREFDLRVKNAWERASSSNDNHVLCFIDLDQFKVINDSCGHIAGDEMLRQISSLLKDNVRMHDSVARLGGDEFGILMECCSITKGEIVAENIRKLIEELQFVWEDNRFKASASIGIVEINSETTHLDELLKQVDSACFAAKEAGRNRVNIYQAEDEKLLQRRGEMKWVHRLHEAIEENRLVLFAQPIVPTQKSSQKLHIEVLVRLLSNENEIIPPGAFLPAAERYGLATQVDQWVVDNVLEWIEDNNQFFKESIELLSINLSGLTLSDSKFLDCIVDDIYNRKIPPEKLCFEITETALIANLSQATNFIKVLRDQGCKFALDDFGSGLSSFAYLKNLQVDYLKIDGMFVRDILRDPVDLALVRSINEMGKVMGKKTIAEFVENDQIFNEIKKIGIDYAQGYGVGSLCPLSELDLLYINDTHVKLSLLKTA